MTSNDAWVDRSQPPHGALAVWQLYQRTGERSLLEANYLALARNQRWWRKSRDPEMRGLLSCGTSDVGEALYKGTAFGARNETGMDNSPTHDEAIYDPETRTLSTFDLGLNCAAALDAEMLARMAQILGHAEDAIEFAGIAESSRRLIREEFGTTAQDLRQPAAQRRLCPLAVSDELLSAVLRRGQRRAGRLPASTPCGRAHVRGDIRPAERHARRSGLR
ncbi:hypothetical protein T190_07550 [Sinorhizobium meliloti CCBAU 01290]|nr:hypothetical protein T190_07550 [Sinorhizobium meliloti CCBAU 01290]